MKKLKLTGKYGIGKTVLLDDEDFDRLSAFTWRANTKGYAIRGERREKYYNIMLHNVVMNHEPNREIFVDHINGNILDNRKSNLRICSFAENIRNRPKQANNNFGYKGVRKHKGKWYAQICLNRVAYHIGVFSSEDEAAYVYDQFAMQLHGEFARLNYA